MKIQNSLFAITFIISVAFFLYLTGSSIQGLFVQSMYCIEDDCKLLCRTDTDCAGTDVCCNFQGVGACEDANICSDKYAMSLEDDQGITSQMQSPSKASTIYPVIGLIFVIVVGYFYLKSVKPEQKPATKQVQKSAKKKKKKKKTTKKKAKK